MARRFGLSLATSLLFLGVAAAAFAQPQSVKPPGNDDCLACHGDADAKRENGTSIAVDQTVFTDSKHGPLACVDCHKDLATLQEFPHAEKLAKVNCASCHDEEGAKYHDSNPLVGERESRVVGGRTCVCRLPREARHPRHRRQDRPRVPRQHSGDMRHLP
ncbi:MAG: cytochrome c3 family protein [Vicinamibacterales bacterium]